MKKSKCYLCGAAKCFTIHNGVRDKPDIDVLKCESCGLVYLSEFVHEDDGYYRESKMWDGKSFAQWQSQTKQDDVRRYEQYKDDIHGKNILDFGCGNGNFLQLAAICANKVMGIEKDEASSNYIKDHMQISVFSDLREIPQEVTFDYIFLFHVIEHIKNPCEVLALLSDKLAANGEIVIETPNANDALLSVYNCSAFASFTYWSAHIILYHEDTLKRLAGNAGLKMNWMRQYQRYPLANHLKWIQKGLPGGGEEYAIFDVLELNKVYESVLSRNKICDTLICSLRRV